MILSINDLKQEIERFIQVAEETKPVASMGELSRLNAEISAYKSSLYLIDQLVPEDGKIPMDRKNRKDMV
jgi:hypothetical protein